MTTTTFEPNSDGGIQASDGLNYTHFHLISSIERESMISHMVLQTGLEPNQFCHQCIRISCDTQTNSSERASGASFDLLPAPHGMSSVKLLGIPSSG